MADDFELIGAGMQGRQPDDWGPEEREGRKDYSALAPIAFAALAALALIYLGVKWGLDASGFFSHK